MHVNPVLAARRHPTVFALATATVMIAQQVAGKAARDALFQSHYDVAQLPKAVIAGAVVSLVGVTLMSLLLTRFGPGRTVPAVFAASAMLFLLERMALDAAPGIDVDDQLAAVELHFLEDHPRRGVEVAAHEGLNQRVRLQGVGAHHHPAATGVGALRRTPVVVVRVVGRETREAMKAILADIQSGKFADEWITEYRCGLPHFRELRKEGETHPIEDVGARLRGRTAATT